MKSSALFLQLICGLLCVATLVGCAAPLADGAAPIDVALLTETVPVTAATFADTDSPYPLIASCPEDDVWLYALDKAAPGGRVLLRQGKQVWEFNWPWLSGVFYAPQLAVDHYQPAAANGLPVLHAVYEEGSGQAVYVLLDPGQDGYQEIRLGRAELEQALAGYAQANVMEREMDLVLGGVDYWLPLPSGWGPEAVLTVDGCSFRLESASIMTEWGVTADVTLGLDRDRLHTSLGTATLYLHAAGGEISLGRLIMLRDAASGLAILPGPRQKLPVMDVLPIELALGTQQGENYRLTLPNQWQGHYRLEQPDPKAADGKLPARESLCALYDQYCLDWNADSGLLCELQLCSWSELRQNIPEITTEGYGHLRLLGYQDDLALLLDSPAGVEYDIDDPFLSAHYQALRDNLDQVLQDFLDDNGFTFNESFPQGDEWPSAVGGG